ncbi:MAG: NAD(P)H-quinone oxidoreductase [Gammaproteobacteria bacterium]|nr:NAD(P)H-quinone oxidoreductase [Gammaproteobacteria bacterium]
MKAIVVVEKQLVWQEVAEPDLSVGEVRIRVHATAVNRADLAQRQGGYPPPPGASTILGLECAGEVLEVGEGVTRVATGDAVCALLAGGGYAEQVVVPAGQVLHIPEGLTMLDAAAIPEVFATAYLNLYMEAGLKTGERVLLHAGASGVGTAAIQLCKTTNNPCFVTAGNSEKVARCQALGADEGWDRHQGSFRESVMEWSGGTGVDVILDPVGAGYLADNLASLNTDGRLVVIGLMGGMETPLHLGLMMMKRLRIIGSTLRARPIAAKAAVMDALRERVWPYLATGEIKPIVEAVIPIEEAESAHALITGNTTVGKVLLQIVR